jgi:two-component system, OmpR family, sensor histidine kinase MtrB
MSQLSRLPQRLAEVRAAADRYGQSATRRMLLAWARLRRAWRQSLQLRMVLITLTVSALLVGLFGVLVASMITNGLIRAKVNEAREQLRAGGQYAAVQLDTITGSTDTLSTTAANIVAYLAHAPTQGDIVTIVGDNLPPQSQPQASVTPRLITDSLRVQVGQREKVAHQFVTADPDGHGDRPYLVFGEPVRVSFGQVELYYAFPLTAEQQAANLVRTIVVATGASLVMLLVVLAALVTRLVVDPVRDAARTARRFSLGLFDQRMHVHGEDDLALLAASFNQMAENLQRQIRKLEDMSRLQRRFTSDVSHELRTPLTTVRMAADLIFAAREDFDPAVARSAELLRGELDRFEDLLTDLLEISRFDAGFAVLDAEPTDLVPIVVDMVERLSSVARSCGVAVMVDLPESPVVVEADPRRVERILRNLIGNAIEHGEGHPVRVTMRTDEIAVAITVRDYGVGLRPGEEQLVFNRFWRADPSRARQTGGTGLGLSISAEDAHLHGGELEAWGAPSRGAQFRLTLPVRAGDRVNGSPLPLAPRDAVADDLPVVGPVMAEGGGHG